ncbi:hypothetical protein NPIL_229251 [Nephila pilipes]|uniref:Uncharacterized protein n=1 Tax=Nephila pilipes TaxID=299642 RepID=A0A8X6IY12_NEPPI|nr:hypothetical protein NPIL_229251 [Nephila pilipes]
MDEVAIKKMRGVAKSDVTRIINSVSEHLRISELLSRAEGLANIFKDFDHYDAMLPKEQSEIEEIEEKYFEIKAKHLSAVDTMNSSSILNDSSKTSENCIINELSQREAKLIHLPCNTVQGQSITFLLTAKGHDCAALSDSGSEATSISESLSCDDSIGYPHASSPDNSNDKTFDLHSTYKDGSQIRPAKCRHPNRALDSSKNQNRRDAEPAPIP